MQGIRGSEHYQASKWSSANLWYRLDSGNGGVSRPALFAKSGLGSGRTLLGSAWVLVAHQQAVSLTRCRIAVHSARYNQSEHAGGFALFRNRYQVVLQRPSAGTFPCAIWESTKLSSRSPRWLCLGASWQEERWRSFSNGLHCIDTNFGQTGRWYGRVPHQRPLRR